MTAAAITSLITGILSAVAKVSNITRDALTKSLEEMLDGVRNGDLLADELIEKVREDGKELDKMYDQLPKE